MPIRRVIIDKSILSSFKGRAVRTYPVEYGELLWGIIEGDTAYVSSIERATVLEADTEGVDIDGEDPGTISGSLTNLGTIHSHPDAAYIPSAADIETAQEPPSEIIMGIMGITRLEDTRRAISYGFFLPSGDPIELCIAEKGKLKPSQQLAESDVKDAENGDSQPLAEDHDPLV